MDLSVGDGGGIMTALWLFHPKRRRRTVRQLDFQAFMPTYDNTVLSKSRGGLWSHDALLDGANCLFRESSKVPAGFMTAQFLQKL